MYGVNAAHGTPGAHDAHGGIQPADTPEVSPNVYHPQAEPSPAYVAYADPAAAHGWAGNAYDETTELPPVVDGAHGARHEKRGGDGGYDYVYENGYDYGDDHDAGRGGRRSHRGRHQPGVWRSRRVAVAAGAVGAVSLAALIAGFAMSRSSSSDGGVQTKRDRTSPTAMDPAVPAEPSGGTSPGAGPSDTAEPSRSTSPSASPSASPSPSASDNSDSDSASDSDDKTPSPEPTTTSAPPPPSTPAATTNAPGNSDNKPGQGQGNTKKPG